MISQNPSISPNKPIVINQNKYFRDGEEYFPNKENTFFHQSNYNQNDNDNDDNNDDDNDDDNDDENYNDENENNDFS